MRRIYVGLCLALVLLGIDTSFARPRKRARNTGHVSRAARVHGKGHARAKKAGAWKKHGQQAIDTDRTKQIQQALWREHYYSGAADGTWNAETRGAMERYQREHGWQSKRVPDARALIKLGLGPNHEASAASEVANTATPNAATGAPQR